MKYLNRLDEKKLLELGKLLGIQFFRGEKCGTEIKFFEDSVEVYSYDQNYLKEKDYYESSITVSDFQIIENGVDSHLEEPTMKQKTLFLNFMIEEFKDDYKKDYIKFVQSRNEKQNSIVDEPAK